MATYVLYNSMAGNDTGVQSARKLAEIWPDRKLIFKPITEIHQYKAFYNTIDPQDEIVLCGGDGTLNHYINDNEGLTTENPVYYFPAGTGNDFWHDLGRTAADEPVRIEKYIKSLPIVRVKGKEHRFLNGVGYGIDGYCCEEGDRQRAKSSKPVNYTSIAIKGLLFHYTPTNATVIVDGKEYTFKKTWLAPCMNGRFYGGGMMPAPEQDRLNEKGEVSVMVFHGYGKLRTLKLFPSIFEGKHVKNKTAVSVFKGKDVTVRFDRPVSLQIDGETYLNVGEYSVRAGKDPELKNDPGLKNML